MLTYIVLLFMLSHQSLVDLSFPLPLRIVFSSASPSVAVSSSDGLFGSYADEIIIRPADPAYFGGSYQFIVYFFLAIGP
ncbi:hypothetical protein M758_UG013200 [Ceratodon purpureus]|nr:hypothetical protein M758_UG013200 [Ceratodon purpureus]